MSSALNLLRRVTKLARRPRSLPGVIAWHVNRLLHWHDVAEMQRFDKEFGVETTAGAELQELGVPDEVLRRSSRWYATLYPSIFRRSLGQLRVDLSSYTFIDFGSGKGKIVMLAADYPFKSIVGVEYAPALHEVAVRNLESFARHKPSLPDVRLHLGDALSYRLPDGPVVCFMFNPFSRTMTAELMRNIEKDFHERPRSIFVIYTNIRDVAEIGDSFDALASFSRVCAEKNILIYEARA